jgi:hypothetical protein
MRSPSSIRLEPLDFRAAYRDWLAPRGTVVSPGVRAIEPKLLIRLYKKGAERTGLSIRLRTTHGYGDSLYESLTWR